MIECPNCDKEFEKASQFNPHWGTKHEGPTPEDIDTSLSSEHTAKIGESISKAMQSGLADRISQSLKGVHAGEDNPFYGQSHDEDVLSKISKSSSKAMIERTKNGDNPMHRDDVINPMHNEESRQNWLDSMGVIEKYGETFKSSWEVEIYELLTEAGIDFEYEPTTIDFGGYVYTPDFAFGEYILEVKGFMPRQFEAELKARMMCQREELYVVVGNYLPSDVYISWNDRGKITQL